MRPGPKRFEPGPAVGVGVLATVGCLLGSCGAREAGGGPAADSLAAAPAASAPADTLVHRTPDGYQIWLTEGRAAADSSGAACYERSVEIRTDSSRVKVPLLFVLEAPTDLGRGFVRAELSLRCRPFATYRVELATGRPFKLEGR